MGECVDRRIKMFLEPGVSLTALSSTGTKIITKEYGELIDLESGCWVAGLGHNKKEITQVINENIGMLFHTHQFFDTEHPSCLVEELVEAAKLNSNYKGTFLSSGSEAVSLAIGLAELLTGRDKKLSFNFSYHGTSYELKMPRDTSTWLDLDISQCLSCVKKVSCKECDRFLDINFSNMAAFVFDPGNSGGLVLLPPQKLISFIAEEIRANGGLIIVNEVTTGFGRTGKWFGFQYYDTLNGVFSPDFIAMGKGLGDGYPISGVLVKEELVEKVQSKNFRYVQSHIDDPLGCMVAREVVKIMVTENLVEAGCSKGSHFRSKLLSLMEESSGIVEVRGRGMMNVVLLNNTCNAKDIFLALLECGYFVGYSEAYNCLRFYAPLIISLEEIDAFCLALAKILKKSNHGKNITHD